MGQVWSKTTFDGINEAGYIGGRGSIVAVTGQNPGDDGIWKTDDDVTAKLNETPVAISIDADPSIDNDPNDRVRGFVSLHRAPGANFAFADGSIHFISEYIDYELYRHLSTMNGSEAAFVPN